MNLKLNCPVCGYQGIEGNSCPNCDTDLSLIRMLQELPQRENSPPLAAKWQLSIALLMLLIGTGLGAVGSSLFLRPNLYTATISPSPSVPVSRISPTPPAPEKPPEPITYIVQAGDSLSAIAEKFCDKGTSWQVIVKANPQLEKRENYIDVGDKLTIPNSCKEKPQ
ncbi:hypothetical protein NIES4074_19860 [Cylindrospermum sp. NIES-4074]|nr:hypothetical protein NIES4074_19860 [Cylindrospermum sp. NIES-4074]